MVRLFHPDELNGPLESPPDPHDTVLSNLRPEQRANLDVDLPFRDSYELFTPDDAHRFLANQAPNRALRPKWVQQCAEMMRLGYWDRWHKDHYIFDYLDRLCNGQHRLHALIIWGGTIYATVRRYHRYDPNVVKNIDTGLLRVTRDILQIGLGEAGIDDKLSQHVTSMVKLFLAGQNVTVYYRMGTISDYELLEAFMKHREVLEAAARMFRNQKRGISRASVKAAFARALYYYPTERIAQGAEIVVSGESSKPHDATLIALRNWLTNMQSRLRTTQVNMEVYGKSANALKHWLQNEISRKVCLREKDPFPLPD